MPSFGFDPYYSPGLFLEGTRALDPTKIGVYLQPKKGELLRITSPYWIPEMPEWVMITDDPNVTLIAAREIIGEQGLMEEPTKAFWGKLPMLD